MHFAPSFAASLAAARAADWELGVLGAYCACMDLTYPTETLAFRDKINTFLDGNLPDGWKGIGAVPPAERYDFQMSWRQTLKDNTCSPRTGPQNTAVAALATSST